MGVEGDQQPEQQGQQQQEPVVQEQPQDQVPDNNGKDEPIVHECEQKQSDYQAAMNLFKEIVGIGVFMLPIGYHYCGPIAGTVILILALIGTLFCFALQYRVLQQLKIDPKNFPEYVGQVFKFDFSTSRNSMQEGQIESQEEMEQRQKKLQRNEKIWVYIADVLMVTHKFNTCCNYVLFFTKYFQEVFCYLGYEDMCSQLAYSVIFSLAIIIPISLVQNFKKFSAISKYGNYIAIIAAASVLFYLVPLSYEHISSYDDASHFFSTQWENGFNPEEFYMGYGIILLAFGLTIQIESYYSMQNKKSFLPVLNKVVYVTAIFYFIVAVVGYFAYEKEEMQKVIVMNLPQDELFFQVVVFLYCLVICVNYGIFLLPGCKIIEDIVHDQQFSYLSIEEQYEQNQSKGFWFHFTNVIIRLGFTAVCFTVALTVEDISLMATWGGLFTILLVYTLPIITHHYAFSSIKDEDVLEGKTYTLGLKIGSILVFGVSSYLLIDGLYQLFT